MATKLKIALVLDDSLDKTDGVQQYVLTLGRWLSQQGHEVHYLVGQTTRTDIPHVHSLSRNVKVRFNHNRMSMPLPASRRKIRALLQAEQFDVVHVQMPYSPFLAGRIIAALPRTQVGLVGTFHVAPHSRMVHLANVLLRAFVTTTLRRFDRIISVSRVAQQFAKDTFGIDSVVVPNTLDLQPFYLAKPFAKYKDVRTIVFLGRLVERKGCHHLLAAVQILHKAGALRGCKVVICGTGPMEASLKQFVRENDLESTVEFAGYISETDKPRYMASADIAVFPSTGGESFGIVLLEAMAAGRGVVLAGNNPGYAGVIGERQDALFEPCDAQQFAEKIQSYLQSPTERAVARLWQQRYVRTFDVPTVGAEVAAVYVQALHKRRS